MMVPEFLNQQLAQIRGTFFAKKTDRQWFQEVDCSSAGCEMRQIDCGVTPLSTLKL
jgi:hypothetical protein